MSDTPMTPSQRPMTLERLRVLLDAYGASAVRWPEDERLPALALLARSAEAEALRRAAARLDAALDLVPAPEGSADLMARVIGHAPGARRRTTLHPWRWSIAAALPLAAAAALVIWLWTEREATQPAPNQITISELGVYTMPSDVLLAPSWIDISRSAPSVGCTDDGLGCPSFDLPEPEEGQSLLQRTQRTYG